MNTGLAIALDGSSQAEKALSIAVKLAKRLPARLILLHICIESDEISSSSRAKPRKLGNPEIYLEKIKKDLTDPGGVWHISPDQVQIRVRYSKSGLEVARIAEEEGAGLLILTTSTRPKVYLSEMVNPGTFN